MPLIEWSPELALDHPEMDATHEEFVALLADTERALAESAAAGLRAWRALIAHTEGHFGQEDRWMLATGFAPENCHSSQHAQVLAVMHEVARLAEQQQDFGPLSHILPGLAHWFRDHAQRMDAALAAHLQALGFDPATGAMARPPAAQAPMTGCGSSQCRPEAATA